MENPTINPQIAPFKKLCMSIGAIPTSFQDSMDYYECVLWLIKYLENTIIPVVNNNGEAVAELQELYTTLQNYVENYFENLDVQEEINNKLDAMAEDGSLQEIINEYLNANAIKFFETVALMKADTNLTVGNTIKTLGYHTINDGGSATYIVRDPEEDETANEKTTIALQNDLIAEYIFEDFVNVKQMGAYGDNTHDDVQAIQFAIDTNKNVIFPSGTYLINDYIEIKDKTYWKLNVGNAIINYSGTNYAFRLNNIRYCDFDFNKITAPNGGCIYFYGSSSDKYSQYVNIEFSELSAESTNDCIHGEASGDCWINEIRVKKGRFLAGQNGVYLLENSSNGLSHWTFEDLGIEGVTQGFLLETGSYAEQNDHYITSINFLNCRTHESSNTIKTIGKVLKGLIIQSRYMNSSQFNISSDTTDWKIIHADRTNYIYNGTFYENEIDISSDVTKNENLNYEGTSVLMTDNYATVRVNITAKSSNITPTNGYVLLSGLPKPKSNIYLLALNYAQSYENPIRLRLTTNGVLEAYYPGTCTIHTGNYPLIVNLTYPIKTYGIQSR